MRLALLTAISMLAFAANSVLARLALEYLGEDFHRQARRSSEDTDAG